MHGTDILLLFRLAFSRHIDIIVLGRTICIQEGSCDIDNRHTIQFQYHARLFGDNGNNRAFQVFTVGQRLELRCILFRCDNSHSFL